MNPEILLVDDDAGLRRIVRDLMRQEGFATREAGSVKEALGRLAEEVPTIVLLDLSLLDGEGLDVLRAMQDHPRWKYVPVICLTARGANGEVVKGLDLGADDYVTKPFRERELISRVKAVLRRRSLSEADVPGEILESSGLRIEVENKKVRFRAKRVSLTEREFDILKILVKKTGQVLSRDRIIELAWGPGIRLSPRVVDVHMTHIRRKLGKEAGRYIRSVSQSGYVFQPEGEETPMDGPN